MNETRKLAAILAADIVGFSRLTSADEDRTLARLRALRSDVIDPTVAVHRGRVIKRTGDGALIEFRSVVDAVRCALEVQNAMAERNAGVPADRRIEFRIGIHVGDVVVESDGDLMGDGVNIAARLEGVASPGAICLSEDAYRQVRSRLDMSIQDLGETQLKNISEPIRIFSLQVGAAPPPAPASSPPPAAPARVAPGAEGRPTVAVAPLKVISGDDEIRAFAEGLREDIVGSLAKQTAIAVVDPGGSEPVWFRLDGSVRAAGGRVRVAFALVDSDGQGQVWSERYDRQLGDLFELEDEVSESVASAVRIRIKARAFERLRGTDNAALGVPDLLSKAAGFFVHSYGHNDEAAAILKLAVDKAPDNSMALAMTVFCRHRMHEFLPLDVPSEASQSLLDDAARAVALDPRSFFARLNAALACQDLRGDFAGALVHAETALQLNPKFSQAQAMLGIVKCHLGDLEDGLELLQKAIAAAPEDPHRFRHMRELALVHFMAGRHDQALAAIDRLARLAPDLARNQLPLAALSWHAGKKVEAADAVARLRQSHPALTLATVRPSRFGDPQAARRYLDGLAEAGLPS